MSLALQNNQTQTLSPQVIQAIEILQMDMQELERYLKEAALENPLLELDAAPAKQQTQVCYTYEVSNGASSKTERAQEDWDMESQLRAPDADFSENMVLNLLVQLPELTAQEEKLVKAILEFLDEDGYIRASDAEIAALRGFPVADVTPMLERLRRLNPPGICAGSLEQCLLAQLSQQEKNNDLVCEIVREYLPLVMKSQYHNIAQRLHVSTQQVREACLRLRALEPRPGRMFAAAESTQYIVPDVILSPPDENGKITIELNNSLLPRLELNQIYRQMLVQTHDETLRQYLIEQNQHASWMLSAVRQREKTILSCTEEIIRAQHAFFYSGEGKLAPLKLGQVADAVGVHLSTVGRAFRNKYLQCTRGVFPFRYFFSNGFPNESGQNPDDTTSSDEVRRIIRDLIAGEDAAHPLSDQKIAELLLSRGCCVARRTVAKYRTELGLANASGRRR